MDQTPIVPLGQRSQVGRKAWRSRKRFEEARAAHLAAQAEPEPEVES